ncbi:ABC transporter substrate-binding protein [Bacillus horti]|uniref:Peptide/nickel transport system substrate-binding protein n=1 Tax=Caldalkalibacillus horti TaxID=77523 RepID=A0ABT9VT34_9BACI|nr:ABC transporter substrate-binding protein [Bacillus horti]MDQ0164151.1 peptide/nickel transport system substrate-binding protein [Bacillus horti]
MRKKSLLFFILMLAVVVALAACGGNSSAPADSEDGGQDSENTDTNTNTNTNTSESSAPKTLIFARGADSTNLDPPTTTDGEVSRVTRQIFESLLEFADDSFEIQEGLAHDFEILDDGLRYRLHLREGVTFHDGTEFNADAVIFNFDRWSDKNHEHHYADLGFNYTYYGNEFGGFKGDEGHIIDDIVRVDEFTIEFVLNKKNAGFLKKLAMSAFSIASPQSFADYGSDVIENPVGTGPFVFRDWKKNESITLDKNPNYWKQGQPILDTVIFQVIPDNSARLTALRSGDIDLMDGLNPDDVSSVESDANLTLYERLPNNVGYLGFNTEKEPFTDPKVRIALNHAVNKEALIVGLYGNLAETAKNPLPPGYLGYNDSIEEYAYDPERAKELLAEAGYPDGFEFDLWTMPVARPYMPDPQKAAEALQADFANVGLKANIVTREWATYQEELVQGLQDVFMLGWSGTNGDPDYFVNNLLSISAIPGGNRTFYRNEVVSDLFTRAIEEIDEQARDDMYQEALEIIHNEAPWIPLVHNRPVLASSSNVLNYVPHPSTSESLANVDLAN